MGVYCPGLLRDGQQQLFPILPMSAFLGLIFAAVAIYGLYTAGRVETDGPDAQGYKWEKRFPALPSTVHARQDVYLHCEQEEKALSCARRDGEAGACDIYLPPNAASWQESHERRHCDGWVHPGGLKW